MQKIIMLLFLLCVIQTNAVAGGVIKVSAAAKKGGEFIKPVGNVLYVDKATPVIMVYIENVSEHPKKLYGDALIGELSSISFKVLDRLNTRKIIKNKISIPGSDAAGFQTIEPGEIRQYEISLGLEQWNKSLKLYDRGAGAFKATVHIHTGPRSICSPHYDLIVVEK